MSVSPSYSGSSGELMKRLEGLALPVDDDGNVLLRGQVIAHRDLSGLDLSGMDFSGADLTGTDLSDARLVGANLADAKLYQARLNGAEFLDASLSKADLSEATGKHAGFARADLREVTAVGADLPNCSWSEAQMGKAIFGGANLQNGRFREADLSLVEFVHADLRGCDLTMVRLDKTNLNRADLRGCVLSGARDYRTANWIGTNVLDVDFHGAYLVRRHLMDEELPPRVSAPESCARPDLLDLVGDVGLRAEPAALDGLGGRVDGGVRCGLSAGGYRLRAARDPVQSLVLQYRDPHDPGLRGRYSGLHAGADPGGFRGNSRLYRAWGAVKYLCAEDGAQGGVMFEFLRRKNTDPKAALREALGEYTLPSFSKADLELMRRIRQPETSSGQIAEILELDPALSVKLLVLANSAAFTPRHEVRSVSMAVSLVGLSQLESLVMSATLRKGVPAIQDAQLETSVFWRTAALRGVLARDLARRLCPARTAECFSAGFLQDLGRAFSG